MQEETLRQSLVRHYRWLRQYGYNDSHSGNASARLDDRFLVTPTGACADGLAPEALLTAPLEGPLPQGASLDAPLHQGVYRQCEEAGAVLHAHVPHLLALTLDGHDFVPGDFEGRYYFGRIRVLDLPDDDLIEAAHRAVPEILAHEPIVVVRSHGAYARGRDLEQAYKWICSAELSARTAWLALQAGTWNRP